MAAAAGAMARSASSPNDVIGGGISPGRRQSFLRCFGWHAVAGVEWWDMPESFNARSAARHATMTGKIARSKAEARILERERSRQLSPAQRVEAIWALTCDLYTIRNGDEFELRLDRSLARVERRRR